MTLTQNRWFARSHYIPSCYEIAFLRINLVSLYEIVYLKLTFVISDQSERVRETPLWLQRGKPALVPVPKGMKYLLFGHRGCLIIQTTSTQPIKQIFYSLLSKANIDRVSMSHGGVSV